MNSVFSTERLVAREMTMDDAEELFKIYGDARVVEWLLREPHKDVDEQRTALAGMLERRAKWTGGLGAWAYLPKGSTEIAGLVLLKPLGESDKIEVGWHQAHRFWGRGYATEIARGAIDHGFNVVGLERIWCVVRPINVASRRVAERCGFISTGLTDEFYDNTHELFYLDRP